MFCLIDCDLFLKSWIFVLYIFELSHNYRIWYDNHSIHIWWRKAGMKEAMKERDVNFNLVLVHRITDFT